MGSDIIDFEISGIPNNENKRNANMLASIANDKIATDEGIITRAFEFENGGYKSMDALHLSSAEHTQ